MTAPKPLQKKLSFPPSTLDRTLACPGSYALEEGIPRTQTAFAGEGHVAHKLAEWALTDGAFDATAYLGRVLHEKSGDVTIDTAMCREVQKYIDVVRKKLEGFRRQKNVAAATLLVEQRIDVSGVVGVAGQTGAADMLIVVEYKDGTGFISVEDFKYGAHVKVEAKGNTQLMTYAAALAQAYADRMDVQKVDLVIHQPRQGHISTHTVSAAALRAFVTKVRDGVKEALSQRAGYKKKGVGALTLVYGEKQCRFCRAKNICPAFNAVSGKPVQIQIPKKKSPRP